MFTILEHLKNRYMSQKAQGIVEYALNFGFRSSSSCCSDK